MINGNMKDLLSDNEKIAVALHNANGTDGLIVDMAGTTQEELNKRQAIKQFNKEVDAYADKFHEHVESLEDHANKIAENVDKIEIMPIGNYLLIKQLKDNPFQRIVYNKSGLIVDTGGFSPIYKNTDSGEYEQEEPFILVGVVQEVGPECKWCKESDTIFYTKPSMVPVPFFKQGLVLVNETRVLAVVNEGLKERFNNVVKK